MTPFEPVNKGGTRHNPSLRISPGDSGGYLNKTAYQEMLEGCERASLLKDVEKSLIAIQPDDEDGDYSILSKPGGGANLSVNRALQDLDVYPDDIEHSYTCPVFEHAESGFIVADLSSVVEDLTEDVHCPECNLRISPDEVDEHVELNHDRMMPELAQSIGETTDGQERPASDRLAESNPNSCSNCGQRYPENYTRCPQCGSPPTKGGEQA